MKPRSRKPAGAVGSSDLDAAPSARRVRPSPVPAPEPSKAAELIAAHFRRDIATGKLREGDALPPEGELIGHFGVSRPTLRSAFRILESESLLTIARGAQGGPRVCHPGPEVIARNLAVLLEIRGTSTAEFLYAQRVIEPAAAGSFAELRPPEGIRILEDLVARQAETLDDAAEFSATASAFYRSITELCGNNILAMFGAGLHALFPKVVDYVVATLPKAQRAFFSEVEAAIVQDQRALLELIKAGDAEGATTLWRSHLDKLEVWSEKLFPGLGDLPFTAFEENLP